MKGQAKHFSCPIIYMLHHFIPNFGKLTRQVEKFFLVEKYWSFEALLLNKQEHATQCQKILILAISYQQKRTTCVSEGFTEESISFGLLLELFAYV